MKKKILRKGELDLHGIKIPCFILQDGTRALSQKEMQNALKMTDHPSFGHARLLRYLVQEPLQSFFYAGKESTHYDPITFYRGVQEIHGYKATILADICDAFHEAKKHTSLSKRQEIIAKQCELLSPLFATVGIETLVDDATGYQYDCERKELQKSLKRYVPEELLKWQKRFPINYYTELFRLNGWNFTIEEVKKRPGVIRRWTNTLIYDQLPEGILEELKNSAPKSPSKKSTAHPHHNHTADIGNPYLEAQINQVLTLFKVSETMQQMWEQFKKIRMVQTELTLVFDAEGHTIEPFYEEEDLSEFSKLIKKALEYNPKKNK